MAAAEKTKGELYALADAVLGGLFPIIAVLSYANVSGLASLAWSTLIAAVFFAAIVMYRGTWRELRNPLLWRYSLGVVLFIGVLFYGLYFLALEHTSPGNAALISLFQVCTTYLLFNAWRGEYFSFHYVLGAALMIIGACIILIHDLSGFNIGDLFMLAATCCAPFGNFFQQKARAVASGETVLFVRSVLSAFVIFAATYTLGREASLADVRASLPFLLLNGIAVFGIAKLFFIESIHRISVTKVIALGSTTSLVTLLFAWFVLAQAPTLFQLASLAPFLIGMLLLTDQWPIRRA